MRLEKLRERLESIKDFYYDYLIYPIKDVYRGFSNILKYSRIIWNDRWYDQMFTYNLLIFKLKDNIKNWDKSHYIGKEFTKKRMIIIVKKLEEYEGTSFKISYDYSVKKKYSKKEHQELQKKLLQETWTRLGRNMCRFWD